MRHSPIIAIVLGLLIVGVVVTLMLSGKPVPDPRDFGYWVGAAATRDWSSEAAQQKPEAEFLYGVSFIRTNLTMMLDRVPLLCALPVVGKRFFEQTTYQIDGSIDPQRLAEGYRWIKKASEHGFVAAKEAEKLFIGKITPATIQQNGISGGTNQTPSMDGRQH